MVADPKRAEAQAYVQAKMIAGEITRPRQCEKCGQEAPFCLTYHPNLDDFDHYMFLCFTCYYKLNPKKKRKPNSKLDGDSRLTFEHMHYDLFVLELTWAEMSEKYGLATSSLQATWKRRCKRRGLNHRVPGMAERRVRKSAEKNRANTNERTISLRSVIDEINDLLSQYPLSVAEVVRYWESNPRRVNYYVEMINQSGHLRPRVSFKDYDRISKAVAGIQQEYSDYHRLRQEVRRRYQWVFANTKHRQISFIKISNALNIATQRPSSFIREDKGTWRLDELERMNAHALEWQAWVREMNEKEFELRQTRYPKKRQSPQSAQARVD